MKWNKLPMCDTNAMKALFDLSEAMGGGCSIASLATVIGAAVEPDSLPMLTIQLVMVSKAVELAAQRHGERT